MCQIPPPAMRYTMNVVTHNEQICTILYISQFIYINLLKSQEKSCPSSLSFSRPAHDGTQHLVSCSFQIPMSVKDWFNLLH